MNNISAKFLSDPDFELLLPFFASLHEDINDFQTPHLKQSVMYVYPLFIFLYALIMVVGFVGNISVIVTIIRNRLYHEQTHYFMCNLALSDILKVLIVLPISLANLLIQNWMFGSFLCYFIPMMQYIPIIASTLTFLLIAVDRYLLMFPMASRAPRFICVLGVWVLSVCVVLPFALYIKYIAIERFFEEPLNAQFIGVGICTTNANDNIEEYVRGLFIALYALPLTIIAFLHVRMSGEMKSREMPLSSVVFEMSSTDDRSVATTRSGSDTPCPAREIWASENEKDSAEHILKSSPHLASGKNNFSHQRQQVSSREHQIPHINPMMDADDDVFDLRKEQRTQKYLITMVTLYGMCLCPFEILRLVRHIIVETNDNTGHLDLAYIIFMWIALLPVCITPTLFASWRMSRPAKDRLKGYFRFSNRRRSRASADNLNSVHGISPQIPPLHHPQTRRQRENSGGGGGGGGGGHNQQFKQSVNNSSGGGHSNMGFQHNAGSEGSSLVDAKENMHEKHNIIT